MSDIHVNSKLKRNVSSSAITSINNSNDYKSRNTNNEPVNVSSTTTLNNKRLEDISKLIIFHQESMKDIKLAIRYGRSDYHIVGTIKKIMDKIEPLLSLNELPNTNNRKRGDDKCLEGITLGQWQKNVMEDMYDRARLECKVELEKDYRRKEEEFYDKVKIREEQIRELKARISTLNECVQSLIDQLKRKEINECELIQHSSNAKLSRDICQVKLQTHINQTADLIRRNAGRLKMDQLLLEMNSKLMRENLKLKGELTKQQTLFELNQKDDETNDDLEKNVGCGIGVKMMNEFKIYKIGDDLIDDFKDVKDNRVLAELSKRRSESVEGRLEIVLNRMSDGSSLEEIIFAYQNSVAISLDQLNQAYLDINNLMALLIPSAITAKAADEDDSTPPKDSQQTTRKIGSKIHEKIFKRTKKMSIISLAKLFTSISRNVI
ncbi:unnamed protein product [Gordionus sp. m RMFG-2023]